MISSVTDKARTPISMETPDYGTQPRQGVEERTETCFQKFLRRVAWFFSMIDPFSCCCRGNSAEDERSSLMSGGAARVILPAAKIPQEILALDKAITTNKTFSFIVGSEDEPRRDYCTGNPQIADIIRNTSNLYQVEGTEISVQREVQEKMESGFRGYDVIGPDGETFNFGGDSLNSLKLIADCAGMEVAEAFDGLTVSNPVSVFQIMIQNHFDPKETSEVHIEFKLGMNHGIVMALAKEPPKLTLLQNKGDGALRFVVEADESFSKMGESQIVRSYRVTQKVTISPGEEAAPAHVEVVRTARIKR